MNFQTAIKCSFLRVNICPFEHKLICYRYATVPKQKSLSFVLLELGSVGLRDPPPGASRCSKVPELIGLIRTRPRFTVSSKMDLNGPQKIEMFKKLDPLHVKKNSSKKISHQKVKKWQSYGL